MRGILTLLLLWHAPVWGSASYPLPQINFSEETAQNKAKAISQEVNGWLAGLSIPQDLAFANACESYDKSAKKFGLEYDPLTHLIQLQGLSRYPENTHSALIAHEYGHVIFRANLAEITHLSSDDLAGSLNMRQLLRGELQQITPTTCQQEEGLPNFIAARKKLLKNDYFTFHAAMLASYDELFADIVAALYTGKGDAIYQAVGGQKINWKNLYSLKLPEDYRGRDFTYEVPFENWRSEKPSLPFYDLIGSQTDYYNALEPIRHWLWANYLEHLPKEKYSLFFLAYFHATGKSFDRIVTERIWDGQIADMNERFRQDFSEEATKLGL